MFSGDGDVKVKPMEMSPNLNSDIAPLLYIWALLKIYAWLVLLEYLHVSHINTHLYGSLESFMKFGIKKSHEMISHIFA